MRGALICGRALFFYKIEKVVKVNSKVTIFDIQRFCIHDGPGIRTVVFMKGCPLRCLWCANPESNSEEREFFYYPDKCIGCGKCAEVCPAGAVIEAEGLINFNRSKCINCMRCVKVCCSGARVMTGKEMSVKEVFNEVMKDKIFYCNSSGGVTFSGGEPMIHPEFIGEVCELMQREGLNTAIETCGAFPVENFENMKKYIDLVLFDIKFIDKEKHKKYCGASNEQILLNFDNLIKLVPIVVRMPVIPNINDTEEDIENLKKFLLNYKNKLKEIDILPYHNMGAAKFDALGRKYRLEGLKTPSKERMISLKEEFETIGLFVKIGG